MPEHENKIGKYKEIIFDSETPEGVRKISDVRGNHPSAVIVFGTGCLDVPQPGHAIFTEQMRMVGEKVVAETGRGLSKTKVIVVVGVGRDSTLKALKIKGRPINPQMNRAYMAASYRDVDYVLLNNEEIGGGKIDFGEVMEVLQPDVFVLNSDDSASLIKRKLCEDMGIMFVTVDRIVPEFLTPTSSTQIIERIQNLKDI